MGYQGEIGAKKICRIFYNWKTCQEELNKSTENSKKAFAFNPPPPEVTDNPDRGMLTATGRGVNNWGWGMKKQCLVQRHLHFFSPELVLRAVAWSASCVVPIVIAAFWLQTRRKYRHKKNRVGEYTKNSPGKQISTTPPPVYILSCKYTKKIQNHDSAILGMCWFKIENLLVKNRKLQKKLTKSLVSVENLVQDAEFLVFLLLKTTP